MDVAFEITLVIFLGGFLVGFILRGTIEKHKHIVMYFKPIFKVGDYIIPIKKSIFCELNDMGLIISVDKNTYSIKTKEGMRRVHIQFQEYYRRVIPNKQQEFL